MTGLSESQVYKWNWDQRKKFNQEYDQLEAEVTRDEFGGYCCKRWGKLEDFGGDDDNICELLGIDLETKALELVKPDFEKRQKTGINDKFLLKVHPTLLQKIEKAAVSPIRTPSNSKAE